jgi:hypothetical protein
MGAGGVLAFRRWRAAQGTALKELISAQLRAGGEVRGRFRLIKAPNLRANNYLWYHATNEILGDRG